MIGESVWHGRAAFGTFRGLEAIGDGVLAPIGRHTELSEFRSSKDDTLDLPKDGETVTFRRLIKSESDEQYSLVGCVRKAFDLSQRPGFYGVCLALRDTGDGSYSIALESCFELLEKVEGFKFETVAQLAELSGIGGEHDTFPQKRNPTLSWSTGQSRAFHLDLGLCEGAATPSVIGLIIEAWFLDETEQVTNLYIYQAERVPTEALDWSSLNELIRRKKAALGNLRKSYMQEAQKILDKEYEEMRADFERRNDELYRENQALKEQLSSSARWPAPQYTRPQNPTYSTSLQRQEGSEARAIRHRVLQSNERYRRRVDWREALKISGIATGIIISLIALTVIFILLLDSFFG